MKEGWPTHPFACGNLTSVCWLPGPLPNMAKVIQPAIKAVQQKTNFVLLSLTEINLIRVYCHICAYAKVLVPHMSIIKCGSSAKLRINGKTTDMQCGNSEETWLSWLFGLLWPEDKSPPNLPKCAILVIPVGAWLCNWVTVPHFVWSEKSVWFSEK